MPPSPSTANVSFGPGVLRIAPLGTAEPANLDVAWPAGWVQLGSTTEGHAFASETSTAEATVAELIDPIRRVVTGRNESVAMTLAEMTLAHLKNALNGGLVTPVAAAAGPPAIRAHSIFEPPEPSEMVRQMLGWDSDDGLERWVWRQVFNTGNVEIPRRKGENYARISATFSLERPATARAYKAIFETSRVAA